MRVLIAYDGSPGSEVVLEHLRRRRAGLPPVAQALLLAVEDTPVPAYELVSETTMLPPAGARIAALENMARRAAAQNVKRLRRILRDAARILQAALPGWTIRTRVAMGFPEQEILASATAWKADLVVLGSRGRSWLQRLVLGSVAREVAHSAECDVRIVRGRLGVAGSSVSLVIGIDGSPAAHAAVMAVARRLWPQGSSVRLVMAIGPELSAAIDAPQASVADLIGAQSRPRVLSMAERAVDLLEATGLRVHLVIKEGDPKRVLLREAKRADCLVVGARGLTGFERLVLGSVSTAVATNASCTVEIIRPASLPTDGPPKDDDAQLHARLAQRRGIREPLMVAAENWRWSMSGNRLKRFLDRERVSYVSIDHEPEYTAQRTAESSHISGRQLAKTVLVKVDGELAMVVVPASSRIDLERLQQELGAQRIELAREGEFETLFPDSEPGAEPPFGNLYGLPVFVSEHLANNAQIAFNAGSHTEVIRMSYLDFERLVKPHIVSLWIATGGLNAGRG